MYVAERSLWTTHMTIGLFMLHIALQLNDADAGIAVASMLYRVTL